MIRPLPAVACCLIAAGLSLNAATASAQFLSERLVPPQKVALPPIPMIGQPAEARVFGAEKPRSHLWALPFAPFPGTPTLLATEQRPADWKRPALDVPGLASESDPTRPQFPHQPVSPRAFAASPDSTHPPVLARFPLPSEPLVAAGEDPSASAAFSVLTNAVPLASPNSVPLLRLSIPDPFEHLRVIRLTTPPADDDAPATAQNRPPLAKLPMVEAPAVEAVK